MKLGWKRIYEGVTYEVIQPHQTLITWEPTATLDVLWKKEAAAEGEIVDWFVPTSTNNYSKDQLMRYTDDKVYKSLINDNVWSPEQYPGGWEYQPDLV